MCTLLLTACAGWPLYHVPWFALNHCKLRIHLGFVPSLHRGLRHWQDPYFMRNHLGSYECKLCLTLHTNEGSYLAHTQGKKHQDNL